MTYESIRSLCVKVVSETQMILGGCELGDLESSLRAIGRVYALLPRIQRELVEQKRKKRVIIWPVTNEGGA